MRYPLRLISSRERGFLARTLGEAGVDPYGVRIIEDKAEIVILRIDEVPPAAANIIKQQLLSLGGDAAVHREVITGSPARSSVHIVADRNRIAQLPAKLARQPFGLGDLGADIERLMRLAAAPPAKVALPRGTLDLSAGPIVMGILNVTPDSFSDGGAYLDPDAALERALAMVEEGAGIIDIGAESTRPGAAEVSVAEELSRALPVLRRLAGKCAVPLSIDTRKAAVARVAVAEGASIINDVSGLRHDPAMIETAIETKAAIVVMHMRGEPETMQREPRYDDAVGEIYAWFAERTAELMRAGIDAGAIIIDPGIGFGKRLEDNVRIIGEIGDFHGLGFPVMVGHSRKSFIGQITGRDAAGRLAGGFAALARCLDAGIQIVRVHDVRDTVDFCRVRREIAQGGPRV